MLVKRIAKKLGASIEETVVSDGVCQKKLSECDFTRTWVTRKENGQIKPISGPKYWMWSVDEAIDYINNEDIKAQTLSFHADGASGLSIRVREKCICDYNRNTLTLLQRQKAEGHFNQAEGYCCPHYGNTCGYCHHYDG